MSRFFIDRPIFAWMMAVGVMLAGVLSILTLPIAQYPTIAPPAVSITATYPGASAATLESAVTQVIEQQLKGIDHLLYFSSTGASNGVVTITVTFQPGTNPDIAQVQVQNKLTQATPLLPTEVQAQGLIVAKAESDFIMVVGLYDTDGRHDSTDLGDYLNSTLIDPISRLEGVGDTQVFGSAYAMRIWLDPYKLNNYKLMPSDVSAAVLAQNVQVPAGELGGEPAGAGQELDATVNGQSRLKTADQFKAIVLKTATDGSIVRLGDVARVEIGGDSYTQISRLNGHPASGVAVKLATGANALKTVALVKARVAQLAKQFPPGIAVAFPVDNSSFITLSISDVVRTLLIAIALVVAVMYLFLQNWRATLIPAIAVPVVLLGTFAVLSVAGYSINVLTLFAMVLAIGLLVDDAIVVVENVQRIMESEGLSPHDATVKSMEEITGALVGIGTVLAAVLLPMAFFGGSTGAIYRQFSITIVAAVFLSVAVALVLTPALCVTFLRPVKAKEGAGADDPKVKPQAGGPLGRFFDWFNTTFDRNVERYDGALRRIIKAPIITSLVYLAVVLVMVVLFVRLPSGFLPDEDQGEIINLINLPAGAVQARTEATARLVEQHYLRAEKDNVEAIFSATGFSFVGFGQNVGISFVRLKDWKDRHGAKNRGPAIVARAMAAFHSLPDGQVFPIIPPAVRDLGNASGFDLELEDQGGLGHDRLVQAEHQLLGMAAHDPLLAGVRPNGQADTPQIDLDIDQAQAGALGLSLADLNATVTAATGGTYINDFTDRGRVKHVYMQADAPFRMSPADLGRFYVRSSSGEMAPIAAFSTSRWEIGPSQLQHYNGVPSLEIQGDSAPGKSSGAAMDEMQKLIGKLPKGIGYEWTGQSFQEKLSGGEAPLLYGLSILVVFMCLAALYESLTIPMAILLVIPLGVVGALLAVSMRGFYNDVYFQVGLLTTIGLSAKNAILIVEFANDAEKGGKTPLEAAIIASRQRLRPILMTSIAFIAGVAPLAISTGAGAGGQNDIGTGVIGGMFTATVLAIFLVPFFFVAVRGGLRQGKRDKQPPSGSATPSEAKP
jgi:HAE1 family hydrophobic/amphiphilic exporter-1/multidrug efflux pump